MQIIREMLWFDWQRPEHVAFLVFVAVMTVATVAIAVRNASK